MKEWDYSRRGIYFITICVHNRACLFGSITDGAMQLNPAGEMVKDAWANMPDFNPGLILDVFVVMPNHFHAIAGLIDPAIIASKAVSKDDSTAIDKPDLAGQKAMEKPAHLSGIVRKFKTFTMSQYKQGVARRCWPPYNKHLWQRSYADHIIETERDLQNHREYIYNNPLKWHLDELNPQR